MKLDPRVDAYIARAPAFAQPILTEVRKRVQRAVPDAEETIKWNVPFYVIGGKLVASMAAFKKHTKVGLWRDTKPEMRDVTTVAELLPATAHEKLLKEAAAQARGEGKTTTPRKKSPTKKSAGKTPPKKKAVAKKTTAKKKAQ